MRERNYRTGRSWMVMLSGVLLLIGTAANAGSPIVSWPYDQIRPAVASVPQANVFLVLWEDHSVALGNGRNIFGRVRASDGTIYDPFAIGLDDSKPRLAPRAVFNPYSQEFLVVYEYEYTPGDATHLPDRDIYARRISEGLAPGELHVITTSDFDTNPVVAYNSVNHEYLVVWQRQIGADELAQHDVLAQRLDSAGQLIGGVITVATGAVDQFAPDVAYAPQTNEYFVVYQESSGGGQFDISGRRVTATGDLPSIVLGISTWPGHQLQPRIAYSDAANSFLVVWEDHRSGLNAGADIYGQQISAAGTVVGENFPISGSDQTAARLNPALAYQPAADEFLVAFEVEFSSTDHDIHRRRVGSDGAVRGAEAVVSAFGADETKPAVAPGTVGKMLVAWEDARDAATNGLDIYAEPITLPVLSGYATMGTPGEISIGLSDVTVQLYCSGDALSQGSLVSTAVTDVSGWYALAATGECVYYNLIETDPAGYQSLTATTVGGTVVGPNWIRYVGPLVDQAFDQNVFWDQPIPTITPTATATATVTLTPTATPNSIPVVQITSPVSGALVSGTINIVGTVSDSDLDEWEVEYRAATEPPAWSLIGHGSGSFVDATLAVWDTGFLDTGDYVLRLSARDVAGQAASIEFPLTVVSLTPTMPPSMTATSMHTPTETPTPMPSTTPTASAAATSTPTATATGTYTATPTFTASDTVSPTRTPSATYTATGTATATLALTRTTTPTGTVVVHPSATSTPLPTPSPTVTPRLCIGDCNGSSSVTVEELVVGVNIALATAPLSACPSFDDNSDRRVTVDELVKAVDRALRGCPVGGE